MPDPADPLAAARTAYARRDWPEAYRGLAAARQRGALATDDLNALADAAWWLGMISETLTVSEECHQRFLAEGRPVRAAMNALDIGFGWLLRGEVTLGSAWVSRARRLLEEQPSCVEQGFLLWMDTEAALEQGDLDAAAVSAGQLQEAGRQFASATLTALGLVGEGLVAIRRGQVSHGLAMLDEAMLPVVAGQLPPEWAGNIYCQLMSVCHELVDIDRSRRWTAATEQWCDDLSSAVMFIGVCRIHRIQLLQLGGQWSRAKAEATIACTELAEMNIAVVGEAHYQLAELHRLSGDLAPAERAYLRASELGRNPQPGLALLRLAQGRTGEAATELRVALLDSVGMPLQRARMLQAHVEIAIAERDLEAAAQSGSELSQIAARYGTTGLTLWAQHAAGAVAVVQGQAQQALTHLRPAHRGYSDLNAPYEAARVRVLMAQAYEQLGDEAAAASELEAAEATCAELGAGAQLRLLARVPRPDELPGGLTTREAEVLAHIAEGATNKEVAAALFISEKTVARHLANIYIKLDVGSRTAAAGWAHQHRLARHRTGA
jgi:DNA-binding NarL/FixJ family response regulator